MRRGLEGMNEDDCVGGALKRKSTRSILRPADNDQDELTVKPARNNNYLREQSARSRIEPTKQSMEFIASHSDDEMLLELDMDEFKINKL